MQPIDFVIMWVDENDPAWQCQRASFAEQDGLAGDNREERYRDLGLLRYWFRGVEAFAPWVNRIHFVTWGHLPNWLNVDHPKLHIVNHADYIPGAYLPTFNSNVLDLNCHRIPGLAEQFVLFNDDMFLVGDVAREDFFAGGLPRATAVLSPMRVVKGTQFYTPMANASLLNEHFSARKSVLTNPGKWLNPAYGADVLRTLLMLPYPHFYGIMEHHLPNAFLKSTFEDVWSAEEEALDQTCANRFRSPVDVSQWLMHEWQMASGAFVPQSPKVGCNFELADDFDEALVQVCLAIRGQNPRIMCISDGRVSAEDFAVAKELLAESFQEILPNKSGFEK